MYKFAVASCYGTDDGLFGTTSRDLTEDDVIEVVDMPQEIVDEIKKLLAEKDKSKPKTQQQQRTNETSQARTAVLPVINQVNNKFQKYREFLVLIQHRNQDYEDWRNVGFALHQVSSLCSGADSDEMYQVFAEWSQVDYPKYDETATHNLWEHSKDNQEGGITFGTLVHWAKEADPEGYKQWNSKWGLGKLKYLNNNFDQSESAKYFHHIKSNTKLYTNDGWIKLNKNNSWEKSLNGELIGFINEICDTVKEDLHKLRSHYLGKLKIINEALANENTSKPEEKALLAKKSFCEQQIDVIKKNCLKIGNIAFQKGIVESLKGLYYNKNIELDSTWYLLGFNDGVYDLRSGEFRDYVPEDYVSMSVGYDYSKVLEADDSELAKMIEQIHPDEEARDCYLSVVATSLEGKTLEKINVFNGEGRNGKGLLDELLRVTLGEYAITMNPAVLCAPLITQGPNPEMAKLNKKRLVIVSEVPAGSRINNSLAKTLTGGDNISARFCHSNETQVNLQCTLIIECNNRPPFRDPCTNAEIARLVDLLFPCEFTEDENKVDASNWKYLANTEYKTKEFKQGHKYAMMKILLNTYKQTKGKVTVPDSVMKRGLLYAELSHWALNWINDNYILVKNPSRQEFVSIQNLFFELKETDIYKNLTKAEKRDFKKDTLIRLLSNSALYSKHYRDRYQPRTNSGKVNARNVLLGFVKMDDDGEPIRSPDADTVDPTNNETD